MTYSLDFRERIMSFIKEGGSQKEAMRIFKVSHNTIYRWSVAETLVPKPHPQRARKIDRAALARDVAEFPHALLRERAQKFDVHVSAIAYQLRQMKLVKKTAPDIPSEAL